MDALRHFLLTAPWYLQGAALVAAALVIALPLWATSTLFERDDNLYSHIEALTMKQTATAKNVASHDAQLHQLHAELQSSRSLIVAQTEFMQELVELLRVVMHGDRGDVDAQIEAFLADPTNPWVASK